MNNINNKKKILVLEGDGIGKEVCAATLPIFNILNLPIDLIFGEIGWECWKKEGNTVPQDTWDKIAQVDAVLLGAITSKGKKEAEDELPAYLQGTNHKFVSPVIQLRQKLGLYANARPSYYISGDRKPYNLCVIRENTEGLYAGFDYQGMPQQLKEIVKHPNIDKYGYEETSCTIRLQTKFGLERLFKFAFEYAVKHNFTKVTFADKPNVMRESGFFGEKIFNDIALQYPNIEADIQNVDAVALWLTTKPEKFGVIVAENMFGDILSDLAGGIMGGLGLAPSANYGSNIAYFEPVHGSAPAMYGQNKANPSAMFLSIALMLEYLGFNDSAKLINVAVEQCIKKSKNLTYDLGGNASTSEFANIIIDYIKQKINSDNSAYAKTAAIITVGDELLSGEYNNSHLQDISIHLHKNRYKTKEHIVCGDNKVDIIKAINRCIGNYDVLIISGGLGPTSDDVTRFAVSDALALNLELNQECLQHIYTRMSSFNLPVRETDKVQALIPKNAQILYNSCGIAHGFSIEKFETKVFVLPGPTKEMRSILQNILLNTKLDNDKHIVFQWKLLGIIETEVYEIINNIAPSFSQNVKYLWRYPYINVSIEQDTNNILSTQQIQDISKAFSNYLVSDNGLKASEIAFNSINKNNGVYFKSDDIELDKYLSSLLGNNATSNNYINVNTVPNISDILLNKNYQGSLYISCKNYTGQEYNIKTPLRGNEVLEFIKEFAYWCYNKNNIEEVV